jgi:hypothetical protein
MTLIEMLKRYEKTLPDSQKRDLLGQAAERIAELEADKAELVDALDIVWDSITDWRGDDWVICLMAKHQQPTKETQQ